MKGNIGKGTEVFKFFGSYFKLVGDFYIAESNENYWNGLMQASDELLKEYIECDFYQFAKALVLVLNVYLSEVKFKGSKKGTHNERRKRYN